MLMVMLLHYGVVVLRPPAEKLNYKILPPPPRAAGRARPLHFRVGRSPPLVVAPMGRGGVNLDAGVDALRATGRDATSLGLGGRMRKLVFTDAQFMDDAQVRAQLHTRAAHSARCGEL